MATSGEIDAAVVWGGLAGYLARYQRRRATGNVRNGRVAASAQPRWARKPCNRGRVRSSAVAPGSAAALTIRGPLLAGSTPLPLSLPVQGK